ncbi:hypothetical protein RD110_18780 [Rhodoferax koreense]|uniref:Uncharacterized protein n=1 Tax=Rhodoferax koreensis TaxID=1842727 RepID=A0A1P8JZ21_9BURK|nr:hypothetical protein [Rhodoferax koreense]APW39000.1 hypothetical protein RD110_18780 [Rhodoferax koreense]
MTREDAGQADLALLVDIHAEFASIDIDDPNLEYDLGNLVGLSAGIMEMLISDWACATSDEHRYILWEEVSNLHTLLRSVSLFIGACEDVREPDFRVLEIAIRCMPQVIGLCPEYADACRAASI